MTYLEFPVGVCVCCRLNTGNRSAGRLPCWCVDCVAATSVLVVSSDREAERYSDRADIVIVRPGADQ